jgi:cytochrome c oxidase subunit 2
MMKMPVFRFTAITSLLTGVAAYIAAPAVHAEWGLNLPPPSTSVAADILDLHNAVMIVCVVIFVVVSGAMIWSVLHHRKSRGVVAATFSHSTKLEIVWTVVPFLILVGLAIPSTNVLLKMEDTTDSELTIKATGYQWKWRYEYPEQGISFFSSLSTARDQIENKADKGENYLLEVDNPIVLPANKKVRILLTANDVIHAWWVPKFGVKKDAIPGYINELWVNVDKPGTYRGQCAELCGKDHGYMPIVAEVLSEQDFKVWVENQTQLHAKAEQAADKTWSADELIARGKEVYAQCVACHGAEGQGVPGAFPALAGGAIATGPMAAHVDMVMNGRPGTAMVAFKDQLNDLDIAAVITYERNAFGNNAGDLVQPADIKANR